MKLKTAVAGFVLVCTISAAPAPAAYTYLGNGAFAEFATDPLGGPDPNRVPDLDLAFVVSRVDPLLTEFQVTYNSTNLASRTKLTIPIQIVRNGVVIESFTAKAVARPPLGAVRKTVRFPAGYRPEIGDVVLATFKVKGAGARITAPVFSGQARIFLSAAGAEL